MSLMSMLNGSGAAAPLGRKPAGSMMKRSKAPGLGAGGSVAKGAADLLSRPSRPHRKGYKQTSDASALAGPGGLLAPSSGMPPMQ